MTASVSQSMSSVGLLNYHGIYNTFYLSGVLLGHTRDAITWRDGIVYANSMQVGIEQLILSEL